MGNRVNSILAAALLAGSLTSPKTLAQPQAYEPNPHAQPSAQAVELKIDAQPMKTALNAFAEQTGLQIIFPSDEVAKGLTAPKVVGAYTPEEALKRLLADSGLRYQFVNAETVAIRAAKAIVGEGGFNGTVRVAQADSSQEEWAAERQTSVEGGQENQTSDQEPPTEELDEVVVTGTHIRDAAPVGSPVLVFTREDIEKSGAATAQQFLAQLPQNFGGGRTEDTNNAIPDGGIDRTYGSAVNLRGLGSGSTLVLVNGRRSAVSGEQEYVDISMIPLSAVERIEVLTDGSSAIYGSDAIGGVVNLIMRKKYSGAETRVRLGGTTQGGGQEYQVAQSFGAGWGAGNVLVNFERYHRDKITSLERDFSSAAFFPQNLTVGSTKNSIHVYASHELQGGIRFFGDLSFADRNIDDWSPVLDPVSLTDGFYGDVSSHGGSVGLAFDIGSNWQMEFVAGANRNELDGRLAVQRFLRLGFGEGLFISKSDSIDLGAKITGDVFPVPAGDVRFAVGLGERKSRYQSQGGFANRSVAEKDGSGEDHEARHVFAELLVPVIGGSASKPSRPRLALSLAGRYEEDSYSTGAAWSSVDPKFGVRWIPVDAVQLRATYGTSFKAPNVVQTDDGTSAWGWTDFLDPQSATGQTRALIYIGNNRSLQPETATTWTVGADLTPHWLSGFRAALTYFHIDYEDRISAAPGSTPALVLHDPAFTGVRTRRVDTGDSAFNSLAGEILGRGIVGCTDADGEQVEPPQPCPMSPDEFAAIMDFGLRNLAVSEDRGIDLNLAQHVDVGDATVEFALNGTYIFDFLRRYTAEAPTLELVSSTYNPPDFRVHATGSWSRRGWSLTGSVHYIDGYRDFTVPDAPGIASWTTVDLNASFDTGRRFTSSWFNNTLVTLNAENVFDRNPPRYQYHISGLGFDPANADPYGRIVSLTLRKSW